MTQQKNNNLNIFDTFVVDSLPRPIWIQQLMEEKKHGGKDLGSISVEKFKDFIKKEINKLNTFNN